MAIILNKGEAHKMHIWETNCDYCDSRLKLFENTNDPAVDDFGFAGTNTVYLEYTCPVCRESQRTYAHEFDALGSSPKEIIFLKERTSALLHRTMREYRPLTTEERVEFQSYTKGESGD